jgi:hypothetical protein
VGARNPARVADNVARLPLRLRNRARARRLELEADDHALLNDQSHDFQALHYYIEPDAQARQLESLGYAVLERLDLDGEALAPGDPAPHSEEVHYLARPAG